MAATTNKLNEAIKPKELISFLSQKSYYTTSSVREKLKKILDMRNKGWHYLWLVYGNANKARKIESLLSRAGFSVLRRGNQLFVANEKKIKRDHLDEEYDKQLVFFKKYTAGRTSNEAIKKLPDDKKPSLAEEESGEDMSVNPQERPTPASSGASAGNEERRNNKRRATKPAVPQNEAENTSTQNAPSTQKPSSVRTQSSTEKKKQNTKKLKPTAAYQKLDEDGREWVDSIVKDTPKETIENPQTGKKIEVIPIPRGLIELMPKKVRSLFTPLLGVKQISLKDYKNFLANVYLNVKDDQRALDGVEKVIRKRFIGRAIWSVTGYTNESFSANTTINPNTGRVGEVLGVEYNKGEMYVVLDRNGKPSKVYIPNGYMGYFKALRGGEGFYGGGPYAGFHWERLPPTENKSSQINRYFTLDTPISSVQAQIPAETFEKGLGAFKHSDVAGFTVGRVALFNPVTGKFNVLHPAMLASMAVMSGINTAMNPQVLRERGLPFVKDKGLKGLWSHIKYGLKSIFVSAWNGVVNYARNIFTDLTQIFTPRGWSKAKALVGGYAPSSENDVLSPEDAVKRLDMAQQHLKNGDILTARRIAVQTLKYKDLPVTVKEGLEAVKEQAQTIIDSKGGTLPYALSNSIPIVSGVVNLADAALNIVSDTINLTSAAISYPLEGLGLISHKTAHKMRTFSPYKLLKKAYIVNNLQKAVNKRIKEKGIDLEKKLDRYNALLNKVKKSRAKDLTALTDKEKKEFIYLTLYLSSALHVYQDKNISISRHNLIFKKYDVATALQALSEGALALNDWLSSKQGKQAMYDFITDPSKRWDNLAGDALVALNSVQKAFSIISQNNPSLIRSLVQEGLISGSFNRMIISYANADMFVRLMRKGENIPWSEFQGIYRFLSENVSRSKLLLDRAIYVINNPSKLSANNIAQVISGIQLLYDVLLQGNPELLGLTGDEKKKYATLLSELTSFILYFNSLKSTRQPINIKDIQKQLEKLKKYSPQFNHLLASQSFEDVVAKSFYFKAFPFLKKIDSVKETGKVVDVRSKVVEDIHTRIHEAVSNYWAIGTKPGEHFGAWLTTTFHTVVDKIPILGPLFNGHLPIIDGVLGIKGGRMGLWDIVDFYSGTETANEKGIYATPERPPQIFTAKMYVNDAYEWINNAGRTYHHAMDNLEEYKKDLAEQKKVLNARRQELVNVFNDDFLDYAEDTLLRSEKDPAKRRSIKAAFDEFRKFKADGGNPPQGYFALIEVLVYLYEEKYKDKPDALVRLQTALNNVVETRNEIRETYADAAEDAYVPLMVMGQHITRLYPFYKEGLIPPKLREKYDLLFKEYISIYSKTLPEDIAKRVNDDNIPLIDRVLFLIQYQRDTLSLGMEDALSNGIDNEMTREDRAFTKNVEFLVKNCKGCSDDEKDAVGDVIARADDLVDETGFNMQDSNGGWKELFPSRASEMMELKNRVFDAKDKFRDIE